jgi:hypothetical protein
MHLSALTFQHQFSRFEELVRLNSDDHSFTSFRDGLPAAWEDYKGIVYKEARRVMGFDSWRPADVGTGTILKKAIQAIEFDDREHHVRNNLVEWQNRYGHRARSHRALLDAQSDRSAQHSLEQWFLDFYQSRMTDAEAFEQFRLLAGNRYDLIAYLFFLKDWKQFMPIRTTHFDKAFALLGLDLKTGHRCSWDNYNAYNTALLEIQQGLCEIAMIPDAELIDAHSFCWMLVNLELPESALDLIIPLPQALPGVHSTSTAIVPNISEGSYDTVHEEQFVRRDAEQRRLGRLAQDIALKSEQKRLRKAGHPNPEEAVQPVWNEPGRGYDILSCELDGTPRYIEVKAARQSSNRLSFFLTKNEQQKRYLLPNYQFYLVLNPQSNEPQVLVIDSGEVADEFLTPIAYQVSFHSIS